MHAFIHTYIHACIQRTQECKTETAYGGHAGARSDASVNNRVAPRGDEPRDTATTSGSAQQARGPSAVTNGRVALPVAVSTVKGGAGGGGLVDATDDVITLDAGGSLLQTESSKLRVAQEAVSRFRPHDARVRREEDTAIPGRSEPGAISVMAWTYVLIVLIAGPVLFCCATRCCMSNPHPAGYLPVAPSASHRIMYPTAGFGK
jgi:hypothetical protein